MTIFRFAPPQLTTDPLVLAKYESARYSTDSKLKTFQFLGCEVDSQLLTSSTGKREFASLLLAASRDRKNIGIIVQNPLPDLLKPLLALIPSRQDLDGMAENHPLFKTSATAETIARLVRSFATPDCRVAVVGAGGFVGRGVVKLLEESQIQCFGLELGEELLRVHEADIVVSATGQPELLDARHLLPSHRLVVDAGFIPLEDGTIKGDVNRSAYDIPQYLTPVPGGVGPLQMATLLERIVEVTLDRTIEKWTIDLLEPESSPIHTSDVDLER